MIVVVRSYAHAPNPLGIPPEWPADVHALADGEVVEHPWFLMTDTEYEAYRAAHQSAYDAWEYQYELKQKIDAKVSALWTAADAYVYQYFSGGAFAQILELKFAGFQKAKDVQEWMLSVWGDYYVRKYSAMASLTHENLETISEDFSNHGIPPWTVPQMLAEAQAAMGANP